MGKELLNNSSFYQQLRATLVRNFKLKIRDSRKTIAEVFLPLYTLGTLIVLKILIPNPNFPAITEPRGAASLFEHFQHHKAHTIAVLPQPNSSTTVQFLNEVNELWTTNRHHTAGIHPIKWIVYDTQDDLLSAYWRDPDKMPLALIFHSEDPLYGQLRYEIRTNPSFFVTPSTTELYSSLVTCRQSDSYWSAVIPIETGDSCPVNQYYYSGFIALQTLLDYTKIKIVTQNDDIQIPHITLEMFPKEAYTGNWMVAFRLVIPIYMVMALSQFITYLLILIVGEKENHIKEGLKIMGLRDSVFWCGWFIIYAVFVTFLTFVSVILLFSLGVFQNTNYLPVFILILLYSFSVILIGFMITPFFDNSRTAGILGNFAVNIMSLLYFLQVFIDDTHTSAALWTVSLISPTGFALAMDKILVLDISGQGVTLDNLWTGPGIPIGGSILMLVVDILLYAALSFYFDCVIPSDHGTKQRPCFCFSRHYWCNKKVPKVPLLNGESANSFVNMDEQKRDIEPVSREMRGKEAIRIVDLHKTFHSCRKPAVNAVNGINLTIYEGQITAILGHNGAGKSTLFNILTGLTSPTSGTVYIFGYDIRDPNDMTMIRRMTGVCPQHDILFETLTPKEHLYFFAAVRGIAFNLIDSEVKKTLRDIDLFDSAETRVKYLSGGQKRKLSVGIAIIGDPKIIILDEPTAGVDPYSRRHMWSILQNRKHGKVILLTTHFMDEADILAERKAVVSRGRLRCCGSSLFLKNKFGVGYHLTLVLDTCACETSITKLVNEHVPKAEKARRHGRELSYILPHDAVNSFVSLFDDIEKEIKSKQMNLGICSYGVSMTTLEEVFLHLETQREEEQKVEIEEEEDAAYEDSLSRKVMKNRALPRSLSLQEKSNSYQSLKNDTKNLLEEQNMENKASLPDNGLDFDTIIPVNGLSSDVEAVSRSERSSVVASPNSKAQRKKHSRSRNGVSKSTKSIYEDPTHTSSSVVKLNSQNKTNWMDLDDIELKPSCSNTIVALLKLRITILFRDIQRLYLLIILPLAFTALGLYLNSIQVISPVMRSILLDNTTYGSNITKFAVHDNTNRLLSQHTLYHHHQLQQSSPSPPLLLHQKHHQHQHNTQQQSKESSYLYHRFIAELKQSSNVTEDYSGNFSLLLDMAPHMAAFNVNSISWSNVSITTLYNDTTQHSLPIILNLISNTLLRMFANLGTPVGQQAVYRHQRIGSKQYGTVDDGEELPQADDAMDSTSSITPSVVATAVESILNIEMHSHPFQQTAQPQEFNIGTFSSALFVGMIFVLIPVSLAVDMVYDREMKAKNQLRVNGLSSALYLSAYFIVLSGLMLLICAALLGLVFLFDIPSFRQPPALITLGLLVFLYSPAGILCSTCFSYFFDRTDSAQSILPNILTFVGLIPFILVVFLDMLGIEVKAAIALHYVFSLLNPMYIPYAAVYFVDRVYIACRLSSACAELSMAHYMTEEMIVMVCGCLLHIPIWAFCLRISDIVKSGGRMRDMFHRAPSEEDIVTEEQCIGEYEDEDVRNERAKIFRLTSQEQASQTQPVVLVKSLRKEFSQESLCSSCCCCSDDEPPRKKVSVRSLSFAVDAGEVLGLLGHNGAGKTTTMKIMTGETVPTTGMVRVAGHSITINQDDAFKTLGYCPQHDALWKNITVREHLELYARIRGVCRKDLNRLVTTYLTGLHINEHANKQTQHCSGGTRRKLSYAMAMVGAPKVVLLDEPSTGMDPKSKRFLWDTILASFHGKRCAMLTTHSMEEADALCSRVGIMVKGELRCLGSTQHLKNLYGAGYTLEIKLKHVESVYSETPIESQPSSSQEQLQLDQSVDHIAATPVISNCIDNRSMALRNFVTDLFPSATLEESFADRLVYSVPQQVVSSLAECFSRLEKAKTELDIEEYSFSQTTLEQVFLKFAHYDEETSNVQ
ncbi:cholesterol transporter ABCA5-like [Topomyia yanbarensis]|uniref:cholesterol transporter ABCA5-like n=1 Tax=Topomyia yanbarensis TaxID=2498891 RepID=UPI00273CC1C0|nr:cholesterol transporter ABCA5-like [Topomyia yanbarensis]XP_058834898.1 cholesterol transporter ABCA5-like [Topomyia yanbarensis]XP_058834899.1 cholesterol transporter ABCA5-like [Topomyia yanbarensis]